MPNIKVEPRSEGLSVVPNVQAQESNAQIKVADTSGPWQALAKVSDTAADITNKLIAADAAVKTQKAKLEYDSAVDEHVANMKQRADYDVIPADHAAGLDAINQSFRERYAGIWDRVEPWAAHKAKNAEILVGHHVTTLYLNQIKGDYVTASNEYIKRMAYASTIEEREGYRADFTALTEDMKARGAINAVDAANNTMNVDNKVDLYRVTDAIEKNPTLAKQMLLERGADGRPLQFPNLTTDQYGAALRHADEKDRFNRSEEHKALKEYQDNTAQEAFRMLSDTGKTDAEKLTWIRDRYTTMLPNGTYAMDARTGYHLEQSLLNGEHVKTDLGTFQQLFQKSLPTPTDPAGTLTMDNIMSAVAAKKLSSGDAKSLLTRVTTNQGKELSGEQKMVNAQLNNEIRGMTEYMNIMVKASTTEDTKQARDAIVWDLHQVADYVRTPAQLKWFKEQYIPDVKKALTAKGGNTNDAFLSDWVKKIQTERVNNPAYYGTIFGNQPKSSDVYNPQGIPGMQGRAGGQQPSANVEQHMPLIRSTFGDTAAPIMAQVMKSESSGDPSARNMAGGGTGAWGLYQIRGTLHEKALKDAGIITKVEDLLDPGTNMKAAKFLYDRDGLAPWAASVGAWGRPVAVTLLKANGKAVTEKNIQWTIDQLLKPRKKA